MAYPLSSKAKAFLKVVYLYSGVADNCNLMAELGWTRKEVGATGRGLVIRGLITYKAVDNVGFEGGVYTLTEEGKRW